MAGKLKKGGSYDDPGARRSRLVESEDREDIGSHGSAVRYHRRREGVPDGRSGQKRLASQWAEPIADWWAVQEQVNVAELHAYLVSEHDYPGSLRSVERYVRDRFPAPRKRARRRVETAPGCQAQADWAEYRGLRIGGREETLYAFHLQLSWSRKDAVAWSRRKDLMSWLDVHNGALKRLGGVPATVRVDNEKTAMARGAGPWGIPNATYQRYAETVRFHIDPCLPRAPRTKGKVERRILDQRLRDNPRRRHWEGLQELQSWTDGRVELSDRRRRCPATGTSVWEAWEREKPWLTPLAVLPQPFDVSVTRKVAEDCTVRFEGRTYSVPFRRMGRQVEVRGCVEVVQIFAGSS